MESAVVLVLILGGTLLALLGVIFALKREIIKEREAGSRRLYELAILKEIGDRTGYSLNIEEILQIITGSLRQFLDYSAVSYIVIGEKLKLSTHLEESVDKSFLSEMKKRMLASLSALLDKNVEESQVEEIISGVISSDDIPKPVGSFFNIPMVVSGKLSGLLTVAHTRQGLYREEDMTILYKITAQASNAVTRLEEVVRIEEEKLLKAKEEFTSMLVHELRSPLDGIRKIIELIVSGTVKKDSPKFDEYINMVHQGSTSMLELVNDMLDFGKLSAGKFEITKEEVSMKEIIVGRISFYKALADGKGIKLLGFFDESLLEKALFDTHAIKQVLNNLISNSLKFTPAGGFVEIIAFLFEPGPEGSIPEEIQEKITEMPVKLAKEDIKADKKSIVVAVFDSGLGIPEDKMERLFASYSQAGNSAIDPEARSTGLGLAIAQGIIKGHGGVIGLKSEEHKGTVFFFAIPV